MIGFFKDENGAVVADLGGKLTEGTALTALEAGVTDAAAEKHVPVYTLADGKVSVKVGNVAHPMLEAHYIEWVAVVTDKSFYVRYLAAGDTPEAEFKLAEGETVSEVYAYCNLHGLWKA